MWTLTCAFDKPPVLGGDLQHARPCSASSQNAWIEMRGIGRARSTCMSAVGSTPSPYSTIA